MGEVPQGLNNTALETSFSPETVCLYRAVPSALRLHPLRSEHAAGTQPERACTWGTRVGRQVKSRSLYVTPVFRTRARATPQLSKQGELRLL